MDSRVIMIGHLEPADTPIQWVEDEYQLLKALIAWFEQFDPDVIIGWSVVDFDFRLLHKRAEFHKLKLTIGRAQQPSLSVRRAKRSSVLSVFLGVWCSMVSIR